MKISHIYIINVLPVRHSYGIRADAKLRGETKLFPVKGNGPKGKGSNP